MHQCLIIFHMLKHLNGDDSIIASFLLSFKGIDITSNDFHIAQSTFLYIYHQNHMEDWEDGQSMKNAS